MCFPLPPSFSLSLFQPFSSLLFSPPLLSLSFIFRLDTMWTEPSLLYIQTHFKPFKRFPSYTLCIYIFPVMKKLIQIYLFKSPLYYNLEDISGCLWGNILVGGTFWVSRQCISQGKPLNSVAVFIIYSSCILVALWTVN